MDDATLFGVLVGGTISGVLNAILFARKNRSIFAGFVVGFAFGLIGLVICAFLPANPQTELSEADSGTDIIDPAGRVEPEPTASSVVSAETKPVKSAEPQLIDPDPSLLTSYAISVADLFIDIYHHLKFLSVKSGRVLCLQYQRLSLKCQLRLSWYRLGRDLAALEQQEPLSLPQISPAITQSLQLDTTAQQLAEQITTTWQAQRELVQPDMLLEQALTTPQ